MARDIAKALASLASASLQSEAELSELVAKELTKNGIAFEREKWLNSTDRVDYLVGSVGVELKLKGPVSAVTRQLARYADSKLVSELLLVTTRFTHRSVPKTLRGKPVNVLLCGSWL